MSFFKLCHGPRRLLGQVMWGGHWKWNKQYFIFKFTFMKNMLKTFCIFDSQQHLQFGLKIQTVSPCCLWYMTNLSKQLDSGSFIVEANGTLWDWSAASVQQAWIISVRREGLLCCEAEGEWDVRKFWGLSVRDKLRTQGWLIVLLGLQRATAPGSSGIITACQEGADWSHLVLKPTLFHVNSSRLPPVSFSASHPDRYQ